MLRGLYCVSRLARFVLLWRFVSKRRREFIRRVVSTLNTRKHRHTSRNMTSPDGPQSHLLFRWMASDSQATGVFVNGSPGEMGSVRSSCMDVSLEDSFSTQFAPLPMSRSSSCTDVDTICPYQSSRTQVSTHTSSEVDMTHPAAGKNQELMLRLQELKLLQQCMQEQLKAHQQEQLQKMQNEQSRLLGMMQTASVYENLKQPCIKSAEQPGSKCSHTTPRDSSVQLVHQQAKEVERTPDPSFGHRSDEDYDRNEESLHFDDKSTCRNDGETEPHDRPIRSGGSAKTFEEMLEEQLGLENEKLSKNSGAPTDAAKVKRPFLRRGEGLSRFTRGKPTRSFRNRTTSSDTKPTPGIVPSAISGPTVRSHQSSEPKRTSTKTTSTTNVVTQRKTAVLNKNNFPPRTAVQVTKAHGHGGQKVRVEGQNESSGLVQLQCKTNNKPEDQKVLSDIAVVPSRQFQRMHERSTRIAENSFEVWLKERGEHWEKDQHREHVELGEFELLERAADEFSFSSNSSFINTLLRRDGRRLSSTPVKSPPKTSFPNCRLDDRTGLNEAHGPPGPSADSVAVIEEASVRTDEVTSECSEDEQTEESDTSVCDNTVFHQTAIALNVREPFSLQVSAPPYDKRSYQDRDGAESPEADEESYRDSTLVDAGGQVEFDDDDTWHEPENSVSSPEKMDEQPDRVLKRKIAISKGAERDQCSNSPVDREPGPPPTCQLVAKMFPALKPKPCPPPPTPPPPEVPDSDIHHEQGAGRSALLRERLVELETEIERFKKENAALSRLKQENQEIRENLRKEKADFQQNMAEELNKWEAFKCEENRKLQREKKLFEKHAAAARARPDKRERDEIQSLKQQLNALQEDLRKREARWTGTHNRLRQQVDSLSTENATLRDQVRTLEKLRLSTWKNAESDREKEGGKSGASSNIRTTKSKSPFNGIKSSPESLSKKMESLAVQNPSKNPAKSSGASSSTACQKEPSFPVTSPLHISQQLIESELNIHHPQLDKNSLHSRMEADRPRDITGKCELEQEESTDGKIDKTCPDGGRLTVFPNGTRKHVSADGLSVTITFFNGDIKQMMPDQRVIYYYAEAQTTHTTYPDGLEVLQFPNNQIEKHFTDGHKEITFPDQTVKNLYPDGREESVLLDGTIIQQNPDGTKQIRFNTGQRELHTAQFKRREYPDGTVKTVYSDGRQETRYPNGRVRLKNPEGHVVMDT
ncbi:centromere protein J isoform X2 [Tachysurus fulvidraco]|uniref:centromere protein J isoform X2 n=1 Tax=Tachysurus fulvidraco TaxID=1234273 RepID=UPI001FEFDD08|nr:centromere protein J isoform X2 [Tachysurus fulvidraco]